MKTSTGRSAGGKHTTSECLRSSPCLHKGWPQILRGPSRSLDCVLRLLPHRLATEWPGESAGESDRDRQSGFLSKRHLPVLPRLRLRRAFRSSWAAGSLRRARKDAFFFF